MMDPMNALFEKKDQHPLFVLEEEDENDWLYTQLTIFF